MTGTNGIRFLASTLQSTTHTIHNPQSIIPTSPQSALIHNPQSILLHNPQYSAVFQVQRRTSCSVDWKPELITLGIFLALLWWGSWIVRWHPQNEDKVLKKGFSVGQFNIGSCIFSATSDWNFANAMGNFSMVCFTHSLNSSLQIDTWSRGWWRTQLGKNNPRSKTDTFRQAGGRRTSL